MKILLLLSCFLILFACKNKSENKFSNSKSETIIISKKHTLNQILGDLDGDNKIDTIRIVQRINSAKYGLKIIYGDKIRIDYIGLGSSILGMGTNNFDWIGIFEIAPKGQIYWNNVNENGDIVFEEKDIKDEDKIKLENDGIFIHVEEACGGGIIYLKKGKYDWIQQE